MQKYIKCSLSTAYKSIITGKINVLPFLGGCSCENDFPIVFSLNREKDYFLAFIYEIFLRLGEIYFGELLGGKLLREANMQNG